MVHEGFNVDGDSAGGGGGSLRGVEGVGRDFGGFEGAGRVLKS